MNFPKQALTRILPDPTVPEPVMAVGSLTPFGSVRYLSQAIFAGSNEVEIEHNGALYRLRLTSLGKLILTK